MKIFQIKYFNLRYLYADDPSKVYTLDVSDPNNEIWKDDLIPPMLGTRMWHGCTLCNINNQVE